MKTTPQRPDGSYSQLTVDMADHSLSPAANADLPCAEKKRKVVFAKSVFGVTMREGGTLRAERSVYGAALVLPQMARTTGWAKTMTIMACRSWLFLTIVYFLQSYLLKMVAQEQNVMDVFAGKMHLCDFGAWVETCPGPGCTGPGGTDVTAPRMYSFDSWVNRNYVKESMKLLFPDRVSDVEDMVDPGEYGVESYWCRLTCCFIFMIALMFECTIIFKMIKVHYCVPTAPESWIVEPDEVDETLEICALESVRLKIAGMPMKWKIINLLVIIVPKCVLWRQTAETGITFLMETSGIANIVANSVGLAFILGLDELVYNCLMSEEEEKIVELCEPFSLYDPKQSAAGDLNQLDDEDILEKFDNLQTMRSFGVRDFKALLPFKLFFALAVTFFFVMEYYHRNCHLSDEGRWVSIDMHLPKSVHSSWFTAFFPSLAPPEPRVETPFWVFPGKTHEQ